MSTISKLWRFTDRGSPSTILNLTTRPIPTLPPSPSSTHLLVKPTFAALNHGSLLSMALIPPFLRKSPTIPEMDLSGVVLAVSLPTTPNSPTTATSISSASRHFKPGDRIAAMLPASYNLKTGEGALSQHVVIPAEYAVKTPEGVSDEDAAGCLTAGMTAWKQLVDAKVKKGDRVLINGASGGVGTMAVQMAKNVVGKDGVVIAICSGKNVELVKSLGADEVIDYTSYDDLPAYLSKTHSTNPFNAIIDTIGLQPLYLSSASYLHQTGIYSSTGISFPSLSFSAVLKSVWQMQLNSLWPLSLRLGGVGRVWKSVDMMNPSLEDRERVLGMLEREEIKVVKDRVVGFGEVREAYARLASKKARGKIVVKVESE